MGLHGNSEVSDVCLVWSRGPRVLVHISTSVLWKGKKREGASLVCVDEVLGQLRLVSAAENFVWASSVCVCATCVFVCARVCLCVSPMFSQRRFTEYLLSPLATLSCGERKKRSFIFTQVRGRCYQKKRKTNDLMLCVSYRSKLEFKMQL